MRKFPLGGIGRGLQDGIADDQRPQGQYRDGQNVRGVDPRTGKIVHSAQRAGFSVFGDNFVGAYPTHMATAFRLRAQRVWFELTNAPEASTVPATVSTTWNLTLNGAALDVDVGPDEQAYYLLESGDVAIVNQGGREVDRIRSAARAFYAAVPRIEVAEDGSVFVAQTNTLDDELPRGYLTRWVRQEDKTWTSSWETSFDEPISMFGYNLGALYVAVEPLRDENEVLPTGRLVRISQPLLGPEIIWDRGDIPRPVLDVTVNENGQALISCPSNEERAAVNAGFGVRSVDWTPSQETDWDLDGWAWLDAFHVNDSDAGLDDGATVEKMRDRRHEETIFDKPDETSPVRELQKPKGGIFAPPVYDSSAFGGAGGIRFESRTALTSDFNLSTVDQGENKGVIPSQELRGGTVNSYLVAMVIQLSEAQIAAATQARIFGQESDLAASQPSWTMQTNGVVAGDIVLSDENSPGSLSAGVSIDTTTRTAVLSWYHDDQVGSGDIEYFVDGTSVDVQAGISDPIQGGSWAHSSGSNVELPGPFFVLGGGLPNRVNLLRDPGTVTMTSEAGPSWGWSLETLRDGVRDQAGPGSVYRMIAGTVVIGQQNRYIDIDFGAPIAFDSISWWNSSSANSADEVTVSWDTVSPAAANSIIINPSAGQGNGNPIQDVYELTTGGSLFRYMRIELTGGTTQEWEISELEVFYQNLAAVDDTAEFTIGEIVTTSVVDVNATDIRQRLEGYLAHRWGIQGQLEPVAHPYGPGGSNAPPTGVGSTARQDRGLIESALRSTYPILAKYGTDGEPVAAYTGAGVGLGAVVQDDDIYTVGEAAAAPAPDDGTMLTHFTDDGYNFTRNAGYAAGTEAPAVKTTKLVLGPQNSLYVPYIPAVGESVTGSNSIRRYSADLTTELWVEATTDRPQSIAAGGFAVDESVRLGPSGQEFLYGAFDTLSQARRIETLGLKDTGQRAGRDAEHLVVLSTGDVVRKRTDGSWETVEAGALPGEQPGSAVLEGNTFFADGLGYRVYVHATGQLRDFENAVKGEFPPRCRLIAAYNSRLVLAGGDNAFTIYQSRFGDPFDFDYGPEIQSIAQAVAGTTASQGNPPEEVTALMPFRNARLYIGTAESLFVQIGDLADGGRLDQLDKSQGVAPGYAWCESPRGIYYFSARGGVMFIHPDPSQGLEMVSSGAIQRRLEEIDLAANRIDMAYNWIDKTVHVFVVPFQVGSDTEHYVYEEPMAAWHKDVYGSGLEYAVTTAVSQVGDTPEDRSLFVGFGGGFVRRWDQYAADDAGIPIQSSATIGPLILDPDLETEVGGFDAHLASDQGPVEVSVRASSTADSPGPPGPFGRLEPGRGLGVPANVAAPAVYVELRGCGRPWAIHKLRAEAATGGEIRAN